MFEQITKSLKRKFGQKSYLSKQVEIVQVFNLYRAEVKKSFPEDRETKPISFKNQTLIVETGSAAQASELRLREGEIIERVNNSLQAKLIDRIVYRF